MARLLAILIVVGLAWGLSIALGRMLMLTGVPVLGVIFWQMSLGAVALAVWAGVSRTSLRVPWGAWPYFGVIAFIGTLLPNSFSYRATEQLPGGVMAIVIALVPMAALPIALALRLERFDLMRGLGVVCGALSVALLIGPDASLPEPQKWVWVLIALIAPICYGVEANYVAVRGLKTVNALQVLFYASLIGSVLLLPIVIWRQEFISMATPWDSRHALLVGLSLLHVFSYTAYVWLVDRAGAVFASQTAYIVTFAGVGWSMILLGETYSIWIWAALLVMMLGLFLVRPKEG